MWNLTGKHVEGMYLGQHKVSGKVLNSRVKYGGSVQHHVQLDQPLQLPWDTTPRFDVLLLESERV